MARLLIVGHPYAASENRKKAEALSRHFDVTVVAPLDYGERPMGLRWDAFDCAENPVTYRLIRLPVLRFSKSPTPTRMLLLGLGRVFRVVRPDVVLCDAEPWALLRWQAWFYQSWQNRNGFVEFSWENVRRCGLKGLGMGLFYRLAAWCRGRAVCGNQAAKQIFLGHGWPAERVDVDGQFGIEVAPPSPKQQIKGKPIVVGFVGRLTEEKGLRELVAALAELRLRRDLRLHLLGAGPLHAELAASGRDWLRVLPAVSHDKVQEVIRSFDLLILPSKPRTSASKPWEEQFGHVLIEGMSEGVATLGSDSGAIPEVLASFPEAIFRHSDPAALRDCVARWLDDSEARADLGRRQRAHAAARWSHQALAVRYAGYLNSARKSH